MEELAGGFAGPSTLAVPGEACVGARSRAAGASVSLLGQRPQLALSLSVCWDCVLSWCSVCQFVGTAFLSWRSVCQFVGAVFSVRAQFVSLLAQSILRWLSLLALLDSVGGWDRSICLFGGTAFLSWRLSC